MTNWTFSWNYEALKIPLEIIQCFSYLLWVIDYTLGMKLHKKNFIFTSETLVKSAPASYHIGHVTEGVVDLARLVWHSRTFGFT